MTDCIVEFARNSPAKWHPSLLQTKGELKQNELARHYKAITKLTVMCCAGVKRNVDQRLCVTSTGGMVSYSLPAVRVPYQLYVVIIKNKKTTLKLQKISTYFYLAYMYTPDRDKNVREL